MARDTVVRTDSPQRKYHGKPVAPIVPVMVGREMLQGVSGVRGDARFESSVAPVATEFQGMVDQGSSPSMSRSVSLEAVLGLLGGWEVQKSNAAR